MFTRGYLYMGMNQKRHSKIAGDQHWPSIGAHQRCIVLTHCNVVIQCYTWLVVSTPLREKKDISQLGWWHSQYMGKSKMFQTTKQIYTCWSLNVLRTHPASMYGKLPCLSFADLINLVTGHRLWQPWSFFKGSQKINTYSQIYTYIYIFPLYSL